MALLPPNNPAVALGVGSYLITPRWFLGLPVVTTLSGLETVYSIQDGVDVQIPLSLIPQIEAITSVSLTMPGIFTVTGSPITPGGSNTIAVSFVNEAQNSFLAAPSSGGAGTPGFRAIVLADLPGGASGSVLAGTGASNPPSYQTWASQMLTWFNSLPTTLPGTAGVLWNNGGTLAQS